MDKTEPIENIRDLKKYYPIAKHIYARVILTKDFDEYLELKKTDVKLQLLRYSEDTKIQASLDMDPQGEYVIWIN